MSGLLLAAAEEREASPIALVVILFLAVALVLLIRSMNKHLRRVPASFDRPEAAAPPDERRADEPGAEER